MPRCSVSHIWYVLWYIDSTTAAVATTTPGRPDLATSYSQADVDREERLSKSSVHIGKMGLVYECMLLEILSTKIVLQSFTHTHTHTHTYTYTYKRPRVHVPSWLGDMSVFDRLIRTPGVQGQPDAELSLESQVCRHLRQSLRGEVNWMRG